MTIIHSETFDSTSVGSLPSGWTVKSGNAWAVTSAANVSSPNGLSSTSGDGAWITYTGSGALADMEVRFDWSPNAFDSAIGVVVRGSTDGQNGYFVNPDASTNVGGTYDIYKSVGGSFTKLTSFSLLAPITGNISVRLRIQGSTISANVWPYGTTEPAGFMASASDSSITAPGYAGLRNQGGTATASADNFTLDNLAAAMLSVSPTSVTVSSTGNSLALTGTGTSWTAGTPGSPTFSVSGGTINAKTVLSATSATLTYTAPASAGTVTITDPSTSATASLSVLTSGANDFSVSPSTESTTPGVATAAFTVSIGGTLTTVESINFSDGGAGGTFTPNSLSWTAGSSPPAKTFTYMPPSGWGGSPITLTLSGAGQFTTSHNVSCTFSESPTVLTVKDPNWFFSPYGWYINGPNEAVALAPGSYLKLGFTGTSAVLDVQVSQVPAALPKVKWSIDGGPYQTAQLSGTALSLATGLTSGNHTLWLQFMAADAGAGWASLTNVLWITGLTLDAGASSVAPTLKTKRILYNGDSGAQGVRSTGGNAGVAGDDALISYASYLMRSIDAEYGQVGFTGLGWTVASAGGAGPVAFFTPGNDTNSSWNKYWAGHSRLVGGLYSPQPDYIITCLGANDWNASDASIEASVAGYAAAARAAAPQAWMFFVIPLSGVKRSAVTTGFNNYQAAMPDAKAVLIDMHTDTLYNLSTETGEGVAMAGTPDGVHSDYTLSGMIGGIQAAAIQHALAGSGESPAYSRARAVN